MEVTDLRELVLEDMEGAFAISIVNSPAIESDFLALSTESIKLKIQDEDKHILTGAILIPDKPILRVDEQGDPYHIFFKPETVNEISQKYLKDYNQKEVTLEHAVDANDITLVETWIKVDDINDKSVALGLDTPKGSWMGSFKVDNEQVWNDYIKTGVLKGFSIEAKLKTKNIDMKELTEDNFWTKLKSIVLKEETTEEVIELGGMQDQVDKISSDLKAFENVLKDLTEMVTKAKQPEVKEVEEKVAEVKEEVKETKKEVEEVAAEKVEMIPHTDMTEAPVFELNKFEYKLTTQERIKKQLLKNI